MINTRADQRACTCARDNGKTMQRRLVQRFNLGRTPKKCTSVLFRFISVFPSFFILVSYLIVYSFLRLAFVSFPFCSISSFVQRKQNVNFFGPYCTCSSRYSLTNRFCLEALTIRWSLQNQACDIHMVITRFCNLIGAANILAEHTKRWCLYAFFPHPPFFLVCTSTCAHRKMCMACETTDGRYQKAS